MIDLIEVVRYQKEFSLETFGPGKRTLGLCEHIGKELEEIKAAPTDLSEWVDVVILALDGAWRAGHDPETIAAAVCVKQRKNRLRKWPKPVSEDKAIEHVRHES